MGDRLDVIAIGEAGVSFPLREDLGDVIVPAQLRGVIVPDPLVRCVERTPVLFAPGEDFLVTPAYEDAVPKGFIFDAQEVNTGTVGAGPEIRMEILPKTPLGMEPYFPQQSGEIHESGGLLERAAGK